MTLDALPKNAWGAGPWQDEPDRLEWEHLGFPCLMVRNSEVTGSWCGYVALSPGHPFFEKNYDDIDAGAHGGLTYSDHGQGHICHKPKPGEPDNVWWVGFDCAHAGDFSPLMAATMTSILKGVCRPTIPDHYWTLQEVKNEVERLAEQLAKSGD